MELSRKELFLNDIEKQGSLGFSQKEIVINLRNNGATDDEIREMKSMILKHGTPEVGAVNTSSKSGGAGIFSIIISIIFIIRGIAYVGSGNTGFGMLFLLLGVVGLVFKLANKI